MVPAFQRSIRSYWLWYALACSGIALFLLWPGGFADKARMVLHGLCAQTPTHTFTFGGLMLPFDGRMTGIYGGALSTLSILLAQGRFRHAGFPPLRVIIVLGLFLAIMAADGFNSLLTDLGVWHPWEPRNELRLVTGFATGITLAIVLTWLLASTVWRVSDQKPIVDDLRQLSVYWAPFVPYAVAVLSGAAWLYVPLSLLLMLSAWLVLAMLVLAMIILAFRLDESARSWTALHIPGAIAGVAGLVIMLLLAFGRVWLERVTGIPSTL